MKTKPNLISFIIYLFTICFICSIIFIYYFEKKLGKELIKCAENQVKQLTTIIINNSIKKYNLNSPQESFLEITKNNKGEIIYIHYNTKKINIAKTQITDIVEKDLQNLIQGNIKSINIKLDTLPQETYEKINNGVLFMIPIGSAIGNHLLNNLGPRIPIKLKLVGEVTTKIKTKVKEYGLNNALVEINVEVTSSTIIQMPFLSKELTTTNEIPLTIEIIQGILPEYYLGNRKISS